MTNALALPSMKVYTAQQLVESVSEPDANNIYLAIGKSTAWPDEENPSNIFGCLLCQRAVWQNMIGAKKLGGNDIRHVIPRNDWTANSVYDEWTYNSFSNNNEGLANANYYIITNDWNVYKCISNNSGSISTVQPNTVSTALISTEDGYFWKYMYTIPEYEQFYYATSNYIPVKTLHTDNNSDQWDVQEAAIDGAIFAIHVEDGGTGYTNANTVIVSISGDGTGAVANATVNTVSNTVETILMTSYGSGYTNAWITITDTSGNGSGAEANPLLGPFGGHGSDPLYELTGARIMVSTRLSSIQQGILASNVQFRQVALIKDPIRYGTTNVESNTVISQMTELTLSGTNFDYSPGEFVFQGANTSVNDFIGYVVEWDTSNSVLKLTNTFGSPSSDTIIGANTGAVGFVTSVNTPDLQPYTGKIMYVNNIEAIERDADQIEEFKIIFSC